MIHCFPHEEETEKVIRYILKLERERDYYKKEYENLLQKERKEE